jgi:hypothetical protein
MPSNFTNLSVDWYDATDAYITTTDITSDVKSIPLFTDTGTGEVNQATIIVRSLDGLYNTTGSTIFAEFDRIRIRCTDLASNTYDRYFEIINIIPSQGKGDGTQITLECLGIEYNTQHIHMSKPFWFEDSFEVGKVVGDIYEENRGTLQPALSQYDAVYTEGNGYGSALPQFNTNNWEFGINEDSCYNRWMDLLEGAGAAVSAGGALTFYELNFLTTGVNAMDFKLRKSGDNSTIVQVQNSVANGVNVGDQEGMITNPTGTNVLAWGSPEHGTLPQGQAKYDSKLLQFIFRPEWVTGVLYEVDARVKVTPTTTVAAKHYKCDEEHTSGTFATDLAAGKWSQVDMADEFGDTIQYSPWTDDKSTVWGNCGCDPDRTTFTAGGWCDINLVINEETFFRTWVDVRISGTNVNTTTALDALASTTSEGYAYDASGSGTYATLPRGFRILLTDSGTPTGVLANFNNMVSEVRILNSDMGLFFHKLYDFTTANTKVQVAVIDEGKIYEDTITAGPTHSWADISGEDWANDCFHPYTTAPANVDGVDLVGGTTRSKITDSTNRPDITKAGGTFATNQNSAVQFVSLAPDAITSALSDASDPLAAYYKNAIGFNIRFPFPNNNYNGTSEDVGDLYGGGANDKREPATLDVQNMNFTSGGLQGFNHGQDESGDYGQINAVAFWLKYSVVESAGSTELNDEHRFRAWFIDTKDNVVFQDFVVRFSNNWEDIRLPIGGFRIYKGRKPIYGFDAVIASFVPPKELEIINIFEWRNIKIGGVQLQSQYDKFGRFNPGAAIVNESGNSVTWSNILGSTRTHLEIEKFKHKEFNIESSGDEIFDIPFGDAFYLKNADIVSDDDKAAEDNNILLVNKRAEYSITKPSGGKGGLRRKLNGSKVFT